MKGMPSESPSCPSSSVILGETPGNALLAGMTDMTAMTDRGKE